MHVRFPPPEAGTGAAVVVCLYDRSRERNMSTAPARSAPPNAAKPMLAQRSPGTLTPTATAAETLLEPSVFITTTDHLPGRSFQSSVPVPVEAASQNG